MRGFYLHKEKGGIYQMVLECKIKDEVTREWVDGICYCDKNSNMYVRTVKDFNDHFTKIESGE